MAERIPIPKTQKDISVEQHVPYDKEAGNPNLADNTNNRGTRQSFRGDNVKPLNIGIQDIDEAVFYYFNNIIRPTVSQNGERLPVPVIYGDSEKWNAYQKQGYYRDQKGKLMAPLIMVKRDSVEKNRSLTNKLDANNPHNYNVYAKKYDRKNSYDQFSVLNNRKPTRQLYASVVPDYLTLQYSCVVFTYYVEQQNKIVEAIQYASDAYWGDPERFKFRAMIDSFNFQTELQANDERVVRSTFDITLSGYIIPEILQRDLNGIYKFSETSKIIFSLETDAPYNIFTGTQVGDRIVADESYLQLGAATDPYATNPPEFSNAFSNDFLNS